MRAIEQRGSARPCARTSPPNTQPAPAQAGGGDASRKLLDKQKKGKARMRDAERPSARGADAARSGEREHPAGGVHRGVADGGGVRGTERSKWFIPNRNPYSSL